MRGPLGSTSATAGVRRVGGRHRNGATAAFVRFEGLVQELFDVQVLAGVRYPDIAEPGDDRVGTSYVLPDAAIDDVPAALRQLRRESR